MQYHLNGFNPGDPKDSRTKDAKYSTPPTKTLPAEVDVLIVGCGPAGLVLAAQLSAFSDITTRIVEKKFGPLVVGQADGISGRSSEIFNAMGFIERVMQEAYYLKAITFWKHDANKPDRITRASKAADGRDIFSEFPHVILNQARVHEFLLDVMRKSPAQLEPDYCRQLVGLQIEPQSSTSTSDYPVTVLLERLDEKHQGEKESVKARYVIGCDGARSSVRQALALPARGDSANKAWGVMDLLVVTDFPDIRMKTVIQSANEGTILIIPREGGHLVRFYIEMDKLKDSERASTLNITSDSLIAAAQRIMAPYVLDVKEVAWWSVYEIGQRVCDKFDNTPENDSENRSPNVFIAGDACHTHSPKAGQGMNVSMHDAFNLGWKLASVIRQQSSPDILHTYSAERREVAQELIAFDRELATMFSAPVESPRQNEDGNKTPSELQKYMLKHDGYVSGTLVQYKPSIVTALPIHQHLAKEFEIGKRFHSSPVTRLADARQVQLGHVIEADGRWRIFIFSSAEDPENTESDLHKIAGFLGDSPESPIRKYTPSGADIDSLIDVRAVLQKGYTDVAIENLPEFFWPSKGRYDLRDYEKLFCTDDADDIFDKRGIDRDLGCMIVVRPDQHVANVLPINGYNELAAFFDQFMI